MPETGLNAFNQNEDTFQQEGIHSLVLDDKVTVLGLALFGEVTPCVSDIREVCFTALFGDSVGEKDTVLATVLIERRVRMPKSVA